MDYEVEIFTPCSDDDFNALWRFNYGVFAAELKMRPANDESILVDKFHNKNIYRAARCRSTGEITGMIAAHWQAPYSAAEHFGDYAVEPPRSGKLAEIRLFALAPNCRKTTVAARLGIEMLIELEKQQVSELVISGISVQKRLYERLGFQVIGEPVTAGDTILYPMRAELSTVLGTCRQLLCYKLCDKAAAGI